MHIFTTSAFLMTVYLYQEKAFFESSECRCTIESSHVGVIILPYELLSCDTDLHQ